jgi:hypothetical protein
MRFAVKMKLLCLVLALVATACLAAVASQGTDAYFSDTKSGAMTGTLGVWANQVPYRLEAGTSKARHWEPKGCRPAHVLPIAQFDPSGVMSLDFGDEVRHNSNASPDVFRVVSLVDQSRTVTFKVSGPISAFVTEVRLGDGKSRVLKGKATASVYIKICVPERAHTGTYTGTLTVHVDGWTTDAQLHMTITVRSSEPRYRAMPARTRQLPRARATRATSKAPATPLQIPTAAPPFVSPSPESTPTPAAAPTPASSPSAAGAPVEGRAGV